jgi:hypothetical protein
MKPRQILTGVLTLALWIATCALGIFEIYLVQEMLLRIYVRFFGSDYRVGVNIRNGSVLILALLYIPFAVGTGEYHHRRVGQRSSWRLFGWTITLQLAILVLAYVV